MYYIFASVLVAMEKKEKTMLACLREGYPPNIPESLKNLSTQLAPFFFFLPQICILRNIPRSWSSKFYYSKKLYRGGALYMPSQNLIGFCFVTWLTSLVYHPIIFRSCLKSRWCFVLELVFIFVNHMQADQGNYFISWIKMANCGRPLWVFIIHENLFHPGSKIIGLAWNK